MITTDSRRVLLKFSHGLGDAVQFSVVLKHLAKYRPNWEVDVVAGRGKHSALHGLCRAAYFEGQPRPPESAYNEVKWIGWYENYNNYGDRPNTKITNSLADEFHIKYDPALGRYELRISEAAKNRAREYLKSICARVNERGKFHALAMHYEGNTSTDRKNLGHHHARNVILAAESAGAKVVLFDWDHRSPHVNHTTVHCPSVGPGDIWGNFGSGDAEMIAAVISQCAGFVGIDSGPGKCASATDTPSLIAWTRHHPFQFHDPAPNTRHLVPAGHAAMAPMNSERDKLATFERLYQFSTYAVGELGLRLAELTSELLGGKMECHPTEPNLVKYGPFWVRRDNFDQDCVVIDDVYFGDAYRTSLYDMKLWDTVLDIGGHIGCFPMLVRHHNPACKIVVVEACPENIPALRANVGHFATIIHGACTYEPGELALLNSVRPNCESTGGSVVVQRAALADPNHPLRQHGYQYWDDLRPLRKVSVAEAMREGGISHVSCLKLDCEGAELSILDNAPELARVRFVFGEYHDQPRWEELRARKFHDWDYGLLHQSDGRGNFHLVNPRYNPEAPVPETPTQISEPVAPVSAGAVTRNDARDICHYYAGGKAHAEITAWGEGTPRHHANARSVLVALARSTAKRVVEFCCGSGVMARLLPPDFGYVGVDGNAEFLAEARAREALNNSPRSFVQHNVREPLPPQWGGPAVYCCFAALKHFSLDDVAGVFATMAGAVPPGCEFVFEVNLADLCFDDGLEFHHTHLTLAAVRDMMKAAGLSEVSREVYWEGTSQRAGHRLYEVTFTAKKGDAPNTADELGTAIGRIAAVAGTVKSLVPPPGADFEEVYEALCGTTAQAVTVAGYNPFKPGNPVTNACRWYALWHGYRLREIVLTDLTRLAVIDRRDWTKNSELLPNPRHTLSVALPAGNGDCAWVVAKLAGVAELLGAGGFDLFPCRNDRAVPYLSGLPIVRRCEMIAEDIMQHPPTVPGGAYNYAPSQPGWHNKYDLFLQVNGHLERGLRLEQWLANVPTNYNTPVSFADKAEDAAFAAEFAKRGPFVTFFAGPLAGNTTDGHNVGGAWTPTDWRHVAETFIAAGVRVVMLGFGVGDQDYSTQKLYPAGFYDKGAEDCIDRWPLRKTLAVIRRAQGHVGYQSGLGVLSVYFGQPAVMFWNRYGVALNDTGATFDEKMATAWVPPAALAAGVYKGAIYGRDDAPTVANFIVPQVLKRLEGQ